MTSSVELTQDLVRYRTINPPGDERACAERLASLLEGAGFAGDLVTFGNGWAQQVARIGGATGRLPLGFTGHHALVGHKGALWLEAVTTGVTAHGSMPEK